MNTDQNTRSNRVDAIMINQELNSSGTNHRMTLKFPSNIDFKNKEVALAYLGIYYSWENISGSITSSGMTGYNNNTFSYTWIDGITYPVFLPDGFYSITDISNYMQTITMTVNGHYTFDANGAKVFFISFVENPTYYATTVTCTPTYVPAGGSNPNGIILGVVPQLNIPAGNNFYKLLGFYEWTSYPPTAGTAVTYYQNSQMIPHISPVTTVNVNCSLAESRTSIFSNSIYQFSPTVNYAEYITITPPYLIFYDVTNGSYRDLTVYFTSETGRPIDIRDGGINVTLLIRDR